MRKSKEDRLLDEMKALNARFIGVSVETTPENRGTGLFFNPEGDPLCDIDGNDAIIVTLEYYLQNTDTTTEAYLPHANKLHAIEPNDFQAQGNSRKYHWLDEILDYSQEVYIVENPSESTPTKKMGRPKAKDKTLNKHVTFLATQEDCDCLDRLAQSVGQTRGAYLRKLLTREFLRIFGPDESHEEKIGRLRADEEGIYIL